MVPRVCSADAPSNIERGVKLVREAAARGANIILLQELFETPYFCQDQVWQHCARCLRGRCFG
jgi:N-carbamoylputrescine amidase